VIGDCSAIIIKRSDLTREIEPHKHHMIINEEAQKLIEEESVIDKQDSEIDV
jgi:hypothetical protein